MQILFSLTIVTMTFYFSFLVIQDNHLFIYTINKPYSYNLTLFFLLENIVRLEKNSIVVEQRNLTKNEKYFRYLSLWQ
jgi:hypothetical protein